MEWKKIRRWLILLLLAADLILAGNIARQLWQQRSIAHTAAENAVTVAAARGIELQLEDVLAMPQKSGAIRIGRDPAAERAAAEKLLGKADVTEPGGGVVIYASDAGELSFRRGGAVEIRLHGAEYSDGESIRSRLAAGGLSMKDASVEVSSGGITLIQSYQKQPVFNCRLACTAETGDLAVRGRWLMGETGEENAAGKSRAQLVLALCDLMESRELRRVEGLRAGYVLQSEDAQSMVLVPVWEIRTGSDTLYLSALTGKQVIF